MKNSFLKKKREMFVDYCPYSSKYSRTKFIDKKCQADIYFRASEKIIPNRYVWHISYPRYRDSILKYGIIPEKGDSGLVYVNNQIEEPHRLWPITYDDGPLYYGWDVYGEEEMFASYDFWRIDCKIAGFKGFKIDPYEPALGVRWGWRDDSKDEDYLCRKEAIPSKALKLFTYKPNSFKKLKDFLPGYRGMRVPLDYKIFDGVVSVKGFDSENPFYLDEVKIQSEILAA